MPFPNFFIVGAAKSGTTSLYHYLSQHPEIYMCPEKEPAYFYSENNRPTNEFSGSIYTDSFKNRHKKLNLHNKEEYLALFEEVKGEIAIGEATPDYLLQPETPKLIFEDVPHAKIIAILRNPFDAAYSDFLMKRRDGVWKKGVTFLDVVKTENLEEPDMHVFPNLLRIRLYDQGIKRYFEQFSMDSVRVFLFEDLNNPQGLVKNCFRFLGVSTDFQPDFSIKHNTANAISSTMPIYRLLRRVPQPLKENLKKLAPQIILKWYTQKRSGSSTSLIQVTSCPPEAKAYLYPILKPSILSLQRLINRDLTHWLD